MPEKTVQKEPGKKPAPSKKPKPQQEVVVQIPLSELHPFPDHPFQVREDASMQETAESVKEYGVLVPALARPREDGGYELIAGHRRKHACELAGLATMPVIVRDIDRDAATIIMVDSNLQRENILPSERAKAYKMKMEAIKRQGARTDLTSPKISAKFRSDDEVGQDAGVSGDTIRNYIALTQLTELEKALTTLFRKGTEVGYTETEIDEFLENIDYHALLQAVWNKAETVYAYRADGKNALSLDYRSSELFKQRATLLYEDVGDSYIGAVFAARSMELWLLEDMGFAVVAKFSVNAGEGEYVTEYRVYKGSDWADSEISLDLEDLMAELAALCDPYYEHEQPIYEL